MNPFYEPYRLLQIYQSILFRENKLVNYPTAHQQFSALNLIAFKQLQHNIDSYLLEFLKANGLILTNVDNILEGLYKTLLNLGIGAPPPFLANRQQYNAAKHRKSSIFHSYQTRQPEIMVTLDINASKEILKELLINGMTIARINCAYGTIEDWRRLIHFIRSIEKDIHNQLPHPCKIYMDLSGAKVRVGPIKKKTFPLKIKINKDRYGFPLHNKKGILVMKHHTHIHDLDSFEFVLPLNINKDIPQLAAGDVLHFTDVQKRKREFNILASHTYGYVVTINKTTYISEGTRLLHEQSGNEYQVGTLISSPVDIYVKSGDYLKIHLAKSIEGKAATKNNPAEISTTLPHIFSDVKAGENIYFNDGKIHGIVDHVDINFIIVSIIYPSTPKKVKENKGINLPDTKIKLPAITAQDIHDLPFIVKHADFLGISFIQQAEDLAYLHQILHQSHLENLTIVAKIETRNAIHNFSDILLQGLHFPKFAVMIARGDLAVEVGFEKLPIIQQEMLDMCKAAHVPTILATEVLDRLIKKGIPSRAELADIFIGSSVDCMMLNKGTYVDKAVDFLKETMQLIVKQHEYYHKYVRGF